MIVAADLTERASWERQALRPHDRAEASGAAGSTRLIPPGETLTRVGPVFEALGVGMVRIDINEDLGAPVFWAYQAEGARAGRDAFEWSYGGKGITVELAQASAVMESIERSYASRLYHPELVRARYDQIAGRAIHPALLGVDRAAFDETRLQEWGTSVSLMTGEQRLIHGNFLLTPYAPVVGQGLFRSDFNGLASGNNTEEAVLHGLYELIERDAWILAQARRGGLRRIDLDTARTPACRGLIDAFRRRGAHLVCVELTRDMPAHTLGLFAFDEGMPVRKTSLLISGTSHDPEVALCRCLTELCQLRANEIFIQELCPAKTSAIRNRRLADEVLAASGWELLPAIALGDLASDAPASLAGRVDWLLHELTRRGVEVFLSRLASHPGVLEVVRLNAVGLQPITGGIDYFADAELGQFFSRRWTARLMRPAPESAPATEVRRADHG